MHCAIRHHHTTMYVYRLIKIYCLHSQVSELRIYTCQFSKLVELHAVFLLGTIELRSNCFNDYWVACLAVFIPRFKDKKIIPINFVIFHFYLENVQANLLRSLRSLKSPFPLTHELFSESFNLRFTMKIVYSKRFGFCG